EAAKAADTCYGGGQEWKSLHIGKLHQRTTYAIDDGRSRVGRPFALVGVRQVEEHHAFVGPTAAEAEAHHAEGADDVLLLGTHRFHLAHGLRGVLHGRTL